MLKKYIYTLFILAICSLMPGLAKAQALPAYDKGMYTAKGDTLPYRILFPQNFDPSQKYPLIIMLHGSGERGKDNEAQLKHCSTFFQQAAFRQKYPAIVVFPQCPQNDTWTDVIHTQGSNTFNFPTDARPTRAMHALMAMIDEFLDKPYVNAHKIYVGGLSIGGMGTFEIIGREPKIFAAAFPMSGGDNTLNAPKYARKVPVWIFHGERDTIVSADHSIVMAEAIKQAGGSPKFTLFPNDGHECWEDALRVPDFMSWLFSNTK